MLGWTNGVVSCAGHGCTTIPKERVVAQNVISCARWNRYTRREIKLERCHLTYTKYMYFPCIIASDYTAPDDNSKQKDLAFVGYTFKRFESLTKRNAL